jgi:hypothetical protein
MYEPYVARREAHSAGDTRRQTRMMTCHVCVGYSALQEFCGFNERAPDGRPFRRRTDTGREEEEETDQSEEACEDARDQRADRPDCNP